MYPFNVRVYGLLFNEQQEILISDEEKFDRRFSKFPGGGLDSGEGLIDGLKREFLEECNLQVEITGHFYTTGFFMKSAFDDSQVISVYYRVKNVSPVGMDIKLMPFDFEDNAAMQVFRWVSVKKLTIEDVTFPIDRHVVKLIKEEYGNELG